ncbi:AMP-binding protein [Marivirga sp. S37H4]|uniref:AMP-binding protein n=1 Tax=Marivirga aurantiaca TaxID=2802615 RepID=A0A935C7Z6_9BACT|nr:AMP-binding protein [Marivirga aurantiaca]MBK6265316.1 AMP-binding protein [Marivirga aurantiaca]
MKNYFTYSDHPVLVSKPHQNLQTGKLQELFVYLNSFSPFYKKIFEEKGIGLNQIREISDIRELPFTEKDDFCLGESFYCVPEEKVVDIVNTSGTTGEPVDIILTDSDLERLAVNEYMALTCAGVSSLDKIQIMVTMDQRFMAGVAYFLGVKKIGASMIRTGIAPIASQLNDLLRLKPTVLIAVPSYVVRLIEYAQERNIDLNKSSVKKIIAIGESIRNDDFSFNNLGKKIVKNWGVDLFSSYGASEIATAFTECSAQQGGHAPTDLVHIESVDELNRQVEPGQIGELVVTTFGVEGMPLLRYKTGDLCRVYYDRCSCGRTSPRIGPILGRKNQMIKYKGTKIYPASVIDAIHSLDTIKDYFIELSSNEYGLDLLTIYLTGMREPSDLNIDEIRTYIKSKIRVSPLVIVEHLENIMKRQRIPLKRKNIKFQDIRKSH